jgi:hypothetical protein
MGIGGRSAWTARICRRRQARGAQSRRRIHSLRFVHPFQMKDNRLGSTRHLVTLRREPSQRIHANPNPSNLRTEDRISRTKVSQIKLGNHLSSFDRKDTNDSINSDANETFADIIHSTVGTGPQDLHADIQIRLLPEFHNLIARPPIPAHECLVRTSGNKMLA